MNGAESAIRTAVDAGVNVCFANPGTTEMPKATRRWWRLPSPPPVPCMALPAASSPLGWGCRSTNGRGWCSRWHPTFDDMRSSADDTWQRLVREYLFWNVLLGRAGLLGSRDLGHPARAPN